MRSLRLTIVIAAITTVALALSISPMPVKAKEKEPERPKKAAVSEAKRFARKVKKRDRAMVNALRVILNRPQDSQRLPFWRRSESLPGLGYTKVEKGQPMPNWLKLRLAAALRAGHPIEYEMKKELETFFNSPTEAKFEFHSVPIELLVCSELKNREDEGIEELVDKADARAEQIVKEAKWNTKTFGSQPSSRQMIELVNQLMARRLIAVNQWKEPTKPITPKLASLATFTRENKQGKGALWHEIDGGYTVNGADGEKSRSYRGLDRAKGIMFLLLAHSLASNISEPDQKGYSFKPLIPLLQDHLRALAVPQPEGAIVLASNEVDYAPRVKSGSTAFFTANIEERLLTFKGDKKPKRGVLDEIMQAALPTPASLYQVPNPLDMGMASELGWVPDVTLMGAGADAENEYDDRALRISLAMLARTGGLIASKRVDELYDEETFRNVLDAITTLERSENPLTFEERVNRAVTRAAEHLLSTQDNNGTFPGTYQTYPGGQALCLLALLDSDIPRNNKKITKGIKWLRGQSSLRSPTYACGIILMMLQKFYEREQEDSGMLDARTPEQYATAQKKLWKELPSIDRKWIKELVEKLTSNFYEKEGWGYSRTKDEAHKDNSNSQYAILGLKAASILGAKFDRTIFTKEAKRFLADYAKTNAAPIVIKRPEKKGKKKSDTDAKTKALKKIAPGGWGYIGGKNTGRTLSMSAAGISSIMVCRDEMKLADKLTKQMDDDIYRHVQGALWQLGVNYPYQRPRSLNALPARSDGFGTFYDMYSVERAGVLANSEKLKDVEWYLEGANILIDGQKQDGSWPVMASKDPYETVNHCFAILFLKRAAIHIADKARKKPITHSGEKKED